MFVAKYFEGDLRSFPSNTHEFSSQYDALISGWCPIGGYDRINAFQSKFHTQHSENWWECEPCVFCGFDGGEEGCDCLRHNPDLYNENGELVS